MAEKSLAGFLKMYWRQILIGLFTLMIIIISVFQLGGEKFLFIFNNNISSFEALAILVMSIMLWIKMGRKSQNRLLWAGLTIGWVLWTIAEWAWGIASFLNKDIPYPSVADFFWLIGYIPMIIALDARSKSIPEEPTSKQRLIIWLASIGAVGLTAIFILKPVLMSYTPGTLLQTFFTLFYPIGDLMLFVFVLRIAFKYQQGLNGKAWAWISIGYVMLTVADLIYCYAEANGIYYPNLQINFVSSLSDTLYSVSYMVILFGLSIMRLITNEPQSASEPALELPVIQNTHILFFTDRNDLINDFSRNYSTVFGRQSPIGQTFAQAVDHPIDQSAALMAKVKASKILAEVPVQLNTSFGQRTAFFSGEMLTNPEGGSSGAILLLRLHLDDYSIDSSISDYHRSIIRGLMKKTGSVEDNEIKSLLTTYYSQLVKGFIKVVETEGGNILGNSVTNKLQLAANNANWRITISPDGNINAANLSLDEAKTHLHEVTGQARKITSEISDEETVNKVEKKIWNKIDLKSREALLHAGVIAPA